MLSAKIDPNWEVYPPGVLVAVTTRDQVVTGGNCCQGDPAHSYYIPLDRVRWVELMLVVMPVAFGAR